ncbi:hypothetical protein SASPL_139042 [Salvia splendens]|uniref:PsbP C-terminal domain-containing protein n=1 Tax=Salvia splendens TaxID=180675 RepID=A0A8X8ZEU5_SALSN|nr:hypothetical protein SASPL_139042 [Salvia splendens]
MVRIQTRRVLDASSCEGAAADKQSATARRRGSGGFLMEEDLRRDMEVAPNCIREIVGALERLKLAYEKGQYVRCCWIERETPSSAASLLTMAVSSLSLNFVSKPFTYSSGVRGWISPADCAAVSTTKCSKIASFDEESMKSMGFDFVWNFESSAVNCDSQCAASGNCKRRAVVLGMGALTMNTLRPSPLLAEEIPEKYNIYVDKVDGYSYYYPSDWRDFDFVGHDSAFKDKSLQLQNVRLSFLPTTKTDIRELGPMDEVIFHLTNDVYSAPNQIADILDMQEKTIDGRNYWTFEYVLTSPNFSRAAFATIAIGNGMTVYLYSVFNLLLQCPKPDELHISTGDYCYKDSSISILWIRAGRYYTLIVGANQRRWRKYRNMLKVVADSFKVMDI